MQDGDVLLYADVGSHLQKEGKDKLLELFNTVANDHLGILGVHNAHLESTWTKGDLFAFFGMYKNENIYKTKQVEANTIFLRKSQKVYEIIKEWLSVFYYDFTLIDDSPSKLQNTSDFKEHRHDQSVWSLLCKKYNATLISNSLFGKNPNNPIAIMRDKKRIIKLSSDYKNITELNFSILKEYAIKVSRLYGVDVSSELLGFRNKENSKLTPNEHFSFLLSSLILEYNQSIIEKSVEQNTSIKTIETQIAHLLQINENQTKNHEQEIITLQKQIQECKQVIDRLKKQAEIDEQTIKNLKNQTNTDSKIIKNLQEQKKENIQTIKILQYKINSLISEQISLLQSLKNIILQPFIKKKAFTLCNSGQLAQAENIVQNVIANNPYMAWAYYILGKVQWEQGLQEESLISLEKAINLEPQTEYFARYRGARLSERGKNPKI